MRYLILICLLLAGCTCSHPVILPDPYLDWQERNARQAELEYQKQQIELYEEVIHFK